jgi:N-acetylneuraminate synthase
MDLRSITAMQERWGLPVGLSDHTLTSTAAVVAVGLGAVLVEKHLIIDRAAGGPDAAFSLEPDELSELIGLVHEAAAVRGSVRFGPSASEAPSLSFRRSLYVVAAVDAGEVITADSVRSIRPAGGLMPKELTRVIGRRAARSLRPGDPLQWSDLAD